MELQRPPTRLAPTRVEPPSNGHPAVQDEESLAGLARELGMPRAFAADAGATLAIREIHMRFLKEARPGACLYATGGVVELGEEDALLLIVIRHIDGTPGATKTIFPCR